MTIIQEITTPYKPSASRLQRFALRRELEGLRPFGAAEQNDRLRQEVAIGGTPVFLSRPLSTSGSACYVEHRIAPSSDVQRVHLLTQSSIAVYDKVGKAGQWQRRALIPLSDSESALTSLPKKVFVRELPNTPASVNQQTCIARALDLKIDELPALTSPAASRLIDVLVLGSALQGLVADALEWVGGTTPA